MQSTQAHYWGPFSQDSGQQIDGSPRLITKLASLLNDQVCQSQNPVTMPFPWIKIINNCVNLIGQCKLYGMYDSMAIL